ncbi:MAG: hypothetical protein HQM09_06895 [Candidatus Riflebacteria bacterium]|nr:hypothetical protein [Candidatus Riflebacteria bacterium]
MFNGVDTPATAQYAMEVARQAPRALMELILMDDPTNYYGRSNGIGILAIMAEEGIISIDDFFEVGIQLLAKIKNLAYPRFYSDEHKQIIYVTAMFGANPLRDAKTYKGPKSTLEHLVSCTRQNIILFQVLWRPI